MLRTVLFAAAAAAFLVTSAISQNAVKSYKLGSLVIEAPWIRATPGGARVAGGYLKITNAGRQPDRLIGGSLAVAGEMEVHETTMDDGVMKMLRLGNGLEIGAGKSVEFKPGGYHLMFTALREDLKEKQTIKGTLTFEMAGTVEIEYIVAPIGAQSADHMHH